MGTLLQDVRYGFRMLRKSPGFTAVAVLTLALGIGANTALFSVVNGVLLNPLPFPHAEQLVTLHESKPNFDQGSISYPNFLDWQKDNHTFSSMAVFRGYAFTLTGRGDAEQVDAELISADLFSILGVKPLIGRGFLHGEDGIGAPPIALLSEGLWRQKFSASRDIVGQTVALDGKDFTIVGVIPSTFRMLTPGFRQKQVYVPVGQWTNPLLTARSAGLGFHGVARLKDGVSIEQASADMASVTENLSAAFPDADKGIGAKIVPLKQQIVGRVRPYLLVLLGAVGFVLLIACVNVANLLLARSTVRAREFAIRAALGAGQGRIVRLLLTESVLISLVGGTLGVLLAAWGTRAALGVLPAALPRAEEIGLDSRVLLFTLAVSLMAGILAGVAPAMLRGMKADLHDTLKEGGRGISGIRHHAQSAFVVAEMALALMLLVGAGLMLRSLIRLWHVDPGFDSHNVLSFNVSLPPSMNSATPDALRAKYREIENKFAAIPGVESASLSWGAIPMGLDDEQLFWLEGQPKPASENDMGWAINYVVSPNYLRTMRIPLLSGRFFTAHDDEHSPRVVVIDDAFARKFYPNQNPIGKRLNIYNAQTSAGDFYPPQVRIIGVVGHVKQWGLDADDVQTLRAEFYFPCMQLPDASVGGAGVLVRSSQTSTNLFEAIRRANREMSSEQVVYGAETMDQMISGSLAARRFSMILLAVFATLALILASIGIYGVISYMVGQRTHEIGVRMALGAERSDILRMVLATAGKLAAIGVGLGLVAALAVTRLLANMLYGIRATDALTFTGVAVLLGVVAVAACCVPARRAAKVDPMIALRYE
jgi:predicted permease